MGVHPDFFFLWRHKTNANICYQTFINDTIRNDFHKKFISKYVK